MDAYYVRIYTLKDGSKVEIPSLYQSYEHAEGALDKFNPSGDGVDDLQDVAYVQIEKRFSPTPIWN